MPTSHLYNSRLSYFVIDDAYTLIVFRFHLLKKVARPPVSAQGVFLRSGRWSTESARLVYATKGTLWNITRKSCHPQCNTEGGKLAAL